MNTFDLQRERQLLTPSVNGEEHVRELNQRVRLKFGYGNIVVVFIEHLIR